MVGLLLLPLLPLLTQPQACQPAPSAPRLDHVVIAVRDLQGSTERLGGYGFRFKDGRLHNDSLLNRHVKFRDGTSLELMSLAGAPTSDMARDYARRLVSGEQGAFAALTGSSPEAIQMGARYVGFRVETSATAGWVFTTFPGSPDAGAVFFGTGPQPAADPASLTSHPNGTTTLRGAWLEAGPRLALLLQELGSVRCEAVVLPGGQHGVRWALRGGTLVLVDAPDAGRPLRVLGVELSRAGHRGVPDASVELFPGFWLAWR